MKVFLILSLIFLLGLLFAEKRDKLTLKALCKFCASVAFILCAFFAANEWNLYSVGIFSGLILSFFGDMFLISTKKKLFLMGLVAFLLAHVCYVGAFFSLGPDWYFSLASAPVFVIVAVFVYRWLKEGLDQNMKVPVLCYISVISVMVMTAFGLLNFGLDGEVGLVINSGAILFFLSDLFVARQRFVKAEFLNKLIGLPLYYFGQLILAFSLSLT